MALPLLCMCRARLGTDKGSSMCPAGPHEDFGIKYNCDNGGPAPEKLTNAIYANTTKIAHYLIADAALAVDLDKLGSTKLHGAAPRGRRRQAGPLHSGRYASRPVLFVEAATTHDLPRIDGF